MRFLVTVVLLSSTAFADTSTGAVPTSPPSWEARCARRLAAAGDALFALLPAEWPPPPASRVFVREQEKVWDLVAGSWRRQVDERYAIPGHLVAFRLNGGQCQAAVESPYRHDEDHGWRAIDSEGLVIERSLHRAHASVECRPRLGEDARPFLELMRAAIDRCFADRGD
jgi:hypothetical protein